MRWLRQLRARIKDHAFDADLKRELDVHRAIAEEELVFLVLLLACANLGKLPLARAVEPRPEIAIRLSLGASRGRVIRQFVTESLVVALAASAVALVVATPIPLRHQ